jgi:hypothetical protein
MKNLPSVNSINIQSLVSQTFKKKLKKLPLDVQQKVKEKYFQWRNNPLSVRFERKFSNIYAVEVTRYIHAICIIDNKKILWIWVGNYTEYSRILNDLRAMKKLE